jgi:tight adherence protein C
LRRKTERLIAASGYYLGLMPDELFAMCVLGTIAGTGFAFVAFGLMDVKGDAFIRFVALGTFCGAMLPYNAVSSRARIRSTQIERDLPGTIDLIALCMSAGLDFPGAIRQITRKQAAPGAPGAKAGPEPSALDEELSILLQELELGHPRRDALLGLAQRVPSESLGEFVSAVVQAEQKGNPLSEVIAIQATVLRTRRTLNAEEVASRTAVLMLIPLMLLAVVAIVIVGGPLFIRISQDGLLSG